MIGFLWFKFNYMYERDYIERFKESTLNGNLKDIKYLISQGANIHVDDDYLIEGANYNGYLDVVIFLVKNGAYWKKNR